MPKIKPFEYSIPAFYRRSALDLIMFAHVTAMQNHSGCSIEDGIFDFLKLYKIDPDEYPVDSALTTFKRIRTQFLYTEVKKTIDNKKYKH